MARLGAAEWRPIPANFNRGGNTPRLLVVHIMQGTLTGTDGWFHNPESQVSAHFGIGRNGLVYQWVNTDDRAWHAADANDHSIGVEHEGESGQRLTNLQVGALAAILAWSWAHHPGIDRWLNKRPEGSGLSYHAMGGAAWGNHPQCPGSPIVGQLPEVLRAAKAMS